MFSKKLTLGEWESSLNVCYLNVMWILRFKVHIVSLSNLAYIHSSFNRLFVFLFSVSNVIISFRLILSNKYAFYIISPPHSCFFYYRRVIRRTLSGVNIQHIFCNKLCTALSLINSCTLWGSIHKLITK